MQAGLCSCMSPWLAAGAPEFCPCSSLPSPSAPRWSPPAPLLSVPKFMCLAQLHPQTSVWHFQLPWVCLQDFSIWMSHRHPNYVQTQIHTSLTPSSPAQLLLCPSFQLLQPKPTRHPWPSLSQATSNPLALSSYCTQDLAILPWPHPHYHLVGVTLFSPLDYHKSLAILPASMPPLWSLFHTAPREPGKLEVRPSKSSTRPPLLHSKSQSPPGPCVSTQPLHLWPGFLLLSLMNSTPFTPISWNIFKIFHQILPLGGSPCKCLHRSLPRFLEVFAQASLLGEPPCPLHYTYPGTAQPLLLAFLIFFTLFYSSLNP